MDKADLHILERIFTEDVERAIGQRVDLPTQFQRRDDKRLQRLEAEGYIARDSATLGGRFPMTVKGWKLTLLGHATYCMSCDESPKNSSEG